MSSSIDALRPQFPGATKWTYLDVAARGLVSLPVKAAAEQYLEQRMFDGGDKAWMFERVETARSRIAELIHASADEIAFTRNISDGINALAQALPWQAGDNVVICEALEHPANIFPWHSLAQARGIEIKTVEPDSGAIPLERIIKTIDEKTRVVTLSTISFSPGFRFPVAELGRHCRERGVLLIVDAAQSIGILDTNVQELQIDGLASSTQKGLLGLYGAGFLYVRREIANGLTPLYLSRMGVKAASGHEASSGDLQDYRLADGAKRFDVGNFNYIAAIALERSLETILGVGTASIERYACGLAASLAEGLAECGFPVFRCPTRDARSHIVSVGRELSDEHDATRDREMIRFYEHLTASGVRLTIRRGMLRFSFHAYNNDADVQKVLELARGFWR
jgi:selenocysteine lyase/cysteine desulfurase